MVSSLALGNSVEESMKMVSMTMRGQTVLHLLSHHLVETDWQGDQTAQYQVPQSLTIVIHMQEEVIDDELDCLAELLLVLGVGTVVKEGSETADTFLSISGLRVIENVRYLNTFNKIISIRN